eukprot:s5_g21.t1
MTDAKQLLLNVLARVEKKFPGIREDFGTALNRECHCTPLVKELGNMREQWKHHNEPVARAMDRSVRLAGYRPEQLSRLGYVTTQSQARRALRRNRSSDLAKSLKRSLKKWRARGAGRPSKMKDIEWQAKVKNALEMFSTASSWTCLGPDKQRRQVRSLCASLATIHRRWQRDSSLNTKGGAKDGSVRSLHHLHAQSEAQNGGLLAKVPERHGGSLPTLLGQNPTAAQVQEPLQTARRFGTTTGAGARDCQDIRRASPQPEGINHAEGMLAAQAKLHKSLVEAYDWHLAAAQLELRNMRRLAEELQSNACYMHCDFMEKLPIPISGSETSDMFHGSARKTLSVLAAYTVQVDKHGKRDVSATVLVSEIISALFSGVSACCRPSSRSRMWVHFKSSSLVLIPGTIRYENLYYFLHKLTKEYKQRTRVNYLVEKHGKAMCDSEVFAPIRRWIDEFLLHPKAFCDSETEVVNILSAHARREMSQNPTGTRFHIEVFHPPKPATSHTLVMDEEFITRSYSWVAVPTQNKRAPVQIYNTVFSHRPPQDAISYALAEKPPEKGEWKNASGWTRRGAETPLHLGKTASWTHSFDELIARDEARLDKAKARYKRNREALAAGDRPDLARLPLSLLQLRKLSTLQIASNPKLLLEGSAGKLSAAGFGLAILAKFGSLQSLKAPGGVDYLPTLKKHLEQEKLDLRDLKIHLLPPDVGSLTKLKELRVGSNELKALPGSICGLSKLQILDVKCNKLAGLPRDLGQLKSLQELDVSANLLPELPASLGELAKLTRLDVSQNQLPSLPETVTDLAALCTLNLRSNPVTELPKRLDELQALKSLDISSTPLGKSLLLPLQGHCPTRRTLYLMNKYDALQTIRLEKTQSSALPDGIASWGQGPPPKPPPANSARHSRTGQAPGGRAGKDSWGYSCFDGGPEDFHIFPRRSAAEEAGDDPSLRQVLQDIEHQLEQCLESSKRQKVFRSLLRQWHPDKRREDEELATRVFQWLQTMK